MLYQFPFLTRRAGGPKTLEDRNIFEMMIRRSFGQITLGLGSGEGVGEDGVEGRVFEEADLEADGDELTEVGGGGEVFAAGAEMGEAEVSGAGEFEAGGDDGGVEVDNGAELDLNAELHGGGGEGLAVEDPAAAVCEGGGKGGK
jgi:hypothetical protein